MKITFISNYLNHHQLPYCTAMHSMKNITFRFVATTPMNVKRKNIGWEPMERKVYEIRSYESSEAYSHAMQEIQDSDVVICGSAPDQFIADRLKAEKLTFRYVERFYKSGTPIRRLPRDILAAWLHHGRFQKYPIYILAASAYTAKDATRFGFYKNRCYQWGYFPEVKRYENIDVIMKNKSKQQILWCGRFLPLKHPDDLIWVAKRLKDEGYVFEVKFIGAGDMQQQMQQMIHELQLEDFVHILAPMKPEQVREQMEQAGIYVFSSDKQEGWGVVLNESMNSGCAVVASHAIGSVPFLINDGENGFVYLSEDTDMLYKKIKYLLDNPEEQQRVGSAAYHTITGKWNAEVAAIRFVELCRSLLSGEMCVDLYIDGPCSRAHILEDDWITNEK